MLALLIFAMLRMEPSMLVCVCQLYHWATPPPLSSPIMKRVSFFFGLFLVLVHSLLINISSNSTKPISYITWFLPPNKWMSLVVAYKTAIGIVILDLLFLTGFLKLFPRAHSIWNRSLSKLPVAHILQYWLLFSMSFQEPEPADYVPQPLLRVCVSLSTSLYIRFSPNSQHRLLKKQAQQKVHQH